MRKVILLALAFAALGFAPVWSQPSDGKVARVLDIAGHSLFTDRRTDGRWFQAYVGMKSYLSERLRTDEKTSAALEFDIGGKAGISPGTEVEIVSQRDIEVIGNKLVLKAGRVWAKIDKQKSRLQIQTSGGVIGIDGTELLVSVDPDSPVSELLLFEGQATITDNEGRKQTLLPGDYAVFGGASGMCVLSYSSPGLRSLVVERFPEFSSFLAARGITTIPNTTGPAVWRSHLSSAASFDEIMAVSASSLVKDDPSLSPSRTSIPGGPPQLSWPAAAGAVEYQVVVGSGGEFDEVVFSARTQASSLSVPVDAPGAPKGRYHFRVIPLDREGRALPGSRQTWFDSPGWDNPGTP